MNISKDSCMWFSRKTTMFYLANSWAQPVGGMLGVKKRLAIASTDIKFYFDTQYHKAKIPQPLRFKSLMQVMLLERKMVDRYPQN